MEHAIGCSFHCPCSLCKVLREHPAESSTVRLIPRVFNEGIPPVHEGCELSSADEGLRVPGDSVGRLPF